MTNPVDLNGIYQRNISIVQSRRMDLLCQINNPKLVSEYSNRRDNPKDVNHIPNQSIHTEKYLLKWKLIVKTCFIWTFTIDLIGNKCPTRIKLRFHHTIRDDSMFIQK